MSIKQDNAANPKDQEWKSTTPRRAENFLQPTSLGEKLSNTFILTRQTPAPWTHPARGGWRAPPGERSPSSASSGRQAQERSRTLRHREKEPITSGSSPQLPCIPLTSTAAPLTLARHLQPPRFVEVGDPLLLLCRRESVRVRYLLQKSLHADRAAGLYLELTQFKEGNHFVNDVLQLSIGSEGQKQQVFKHLITTDVIAS